jgi:hypothetical protein
LRNIGNILMEIGLECAELFSIGRCYQKCFPDVLCERFLATVQSECRAAEKLNRPVLLVIFSHGEERTYDVAAHGGRRDGTIIEGSLLRIDKIKGAIRGKVDVMALMTSCYSGGWRRHIQGSETF